MALKLNYYDGKYNINFPEAYAKINSFRGDKKEIVIFVSVYPSEEARTSSLNYLDTIVVHMPFSEITGELFPSMYQWLTKQKQFENSISC
jgi:hypothetical protein